MLFSKAALAIVASAPLLLALPIEGNSLQVRGLEGRAEHVSLVNRMDSKPKMKLRPLNDRVIVKKLDQETKTASGIIIPDAAKEKPQEGIVIAKGPGRSKTW